MLGKLLGRRRSRGPVVPPRAPEGTRVYAIGDIHGRADLLRDMHQLIHEDAYARQCPRNVVVYLGDYVDRGPDSAEVIDILLDEKLPGFESVHLAGNHEDTVIRFLSDITVAPLWLEYGGSATLYSYGVKPPNMTETDLVRAQAELLERLPERHLRFMRDLGLCHVEGDWFFVHAGVKPGIPLEAQQRQDMLWIRGEFLGCDADFGKIIVHGHTVSAAPDVRRNRIGIDTGAFMTGCLTCLVLEGDRWSFLQTGPGA
jgi:serine/threonine protein phosphatase 1